MNYHEAPYPTDLFTKNMSQACFPGWCKKVCQLTRPTFLPKQYYQHVFPGVKRSVRYASEGKSECWLFRASPWMNGATNQWMDEWTDTTEGRERNDLFFTGIDDSWCEISRTNLTLAFFWFDWFFSLFLLYISFLTLTPMMRRRDEEINLLLSSDPYLTSKFWRFTTCVCVALKWLVYWLKCVRCASSGGIRQCCGSVFQSYWKTHLSIFERTTIILGQKWTSIQASKRLKLSRNGPNANFSAWSCIGKPRVHSL